MGTSIGSINAAISSNPPAPLSNFRGAYATIGEILALADPVAGDFAILEREQPLSDIFYDYDVSFGTWRPRPGEDFKGYFTDLDALITAFPNPQPDWIAVNNNDRAIKYIVFNGGWIEEPTTLDAAYVDQLISDLKNDIALNNNRSKINYIAGSYTITDAQNFSKNYCTSPLTITLNPIQSEMRKGLLSFHINDSNGDVAIAYDATKITVKGHDSVNDEPLKIKSISDDAVKGGVSIDYDGFNSTTNKMEYHVYGALV